MDASMRRRLDAAEHELGAQPDGPLVIIVSRVRDNSESITIGGERVTRRKYERRLAGGLSPRQIYQINVVN